jgi:hypothetical protein
MADYKELLRRAVEALPENNGAARRAVYEKARAALVGQLRGITPPLPARDITTHRLQLEDCIRQVEQESSEANLSGIGQEAPAAPSLPPVFAAEAKAKLDAKPAAPMAKPPVKVNGKAEPDKSKPANSIEAIIAAAERDRPDPPAPQPPKPPEFKQRPPKSQPVLVAKTEPPPNQPVPQQPPKPSAAPPAAAERPQPAKRPDGRPLPSIVARAEAAKGRPAGPSFGVAIDNARRGPKIEPRRDGRLSIAAARQPEPIPYDRPEDVPAMSAVREVEVEHQPADPQNTIDRAIAALDREARGEIAPPSYDDEPAYDDEPRQPQRRNNGYANGRGELNGVNGREMGRGESNGRGDYNGNGRGNDFNGGNGGERRSVMDIAMSRESKAPRPAKEFATPRRSAAKPRERNVPRAQAERGGMGAVTIFVIIFVALLVGAGGMGFWAWQEGFINLDAMFGKGNAVATATADPVVTPDSTGPGNTDTPVTTDPSTQLKADQGTQTATANATDSSAPLALQSPPGDGKTEERLGGDANAAPQTAQDATLAAIDPASVAGSQSLLLEASDTGKTGAVPFSGTVDWSKGVDENGQPTLIGKANIPARNLAVQLLIRKNSDPSLPASHLMEINFTVSDSFIGGSIAGLPGVLLKNEELVQGSPLVGASARVVGNSFLFALSAAPTDAAANVNLLMSRKWIDLALIYASGKRAIITLEKDDKAQKMFNDVFAAWGPVKTGKG